MPSKDLKKMMAAMALSKEEIDDFLSAPRMARMATVSNGKPHLVPVWYYYDGTNILITTPKEARRIKNLKDNPYVSIVIDIVTGKPGDISYLDGKAVIIEGEAEIKDDTDGSFAKNMYERYVGKDALNNQMVQFSIGIPRHILTIKPVKVMSWALSKVSKIKN